MALGQATIPVAGPADAVARVLPLLEATSTGVFEFGEDPGAANVAKLGGNFLIAAAIESMAESLALAEANGVDRVQMMTMLNSTIFDCLIYKGYGQRVAERDHTPYPDAHFSLEVSRPASEQAGGQAKRAGQQLLSMLGGGVCCTVLQLGLKDVSLVSSTAAQSNVPMPICSQLKDRFLSASAAGWNDLDWSAIGMKVSSDAGVDVTAHAAKCASK
jgi:3-hydroxyisobutyrate dehydrogenase-like beta-hydroxyacid dehydrogenase